MFINIIAFIICGQYIMFMFSSAEETAWQMFYMNIVDLRISREGFCDYRNVINIVNLRF